MTKVLLLLLACIVLAPSTFGQSATGRLVGTISGPDGAIPGATLNITDQQTKREITVTSSGEGTFIVPNIAVGTYTIKVTAQGFKTFTATDVIVEVGRE